MPARPDRAEKQKQRSKSRSPSESSKGKASKASRALAKKPAPAEHFPKKKETVREIVTQKPMKTAKGAKPESPPLKVPAKTDKAKVAAKAPEAKTAPVAKAARTIAGAVPEATKSAAVKTATIKTAKVPKAPKAPKPPKERRTVQPPPPLRTYKFIGVPSFTGPKPVKYTIPPPPPEPPPPPPASLEERVALVQTRLAKQDEEFKRRYLENFDMSWIYHDSALEGVVYSFQELRTAVDSSATVVQDSTLQPVCEEIRRHKQAIEFVRDFAIKKRLPITLDVVKRIYLILHPEEGDLKTLKYRKDIPQHRLYFHEYAAPDKIAYKVRQIVDWINDPETKRGRNALRIAARAHYDLVRVFPFTHDSGKVARLLMNMLLMRAGYEPAIIHSTERQRYYEALKGSAAIVLHMAQEAEENGLASIEKLLEEHETNTRSFVS
jgi:Fic family protein